MRWRFGWTERRLHSLAIPLAAFVAVVPLVTHGCSCGHDFDFHVVSWMEAARQFSYGDFYPQWARSPAYFAGEPRFVFYPPLSWILGALIGLITTHVPGVPVSAGWNSAPILFTWFALTISGLTCYRLAREFASAGIALLSAALYLANPYMLFTAYERTAYAELLAAAWIPLLLLSILRQRVTISGVALPIALLWLTNAPAAVMGSYTLVALAILRVIWDLRNRNEATPPVRAALNSGAGTVLGIALAAAYIFPAQVERRFVQIAMVLVPGMRIRDNFIFARNFGGWNLPLTHFAPDPAVLSDLPHAQVLETVSRISAIMLCATATLLMVATLTARWNKGSAPESSSRLLISLAILSIGIAFLITPLSAPLWPYIPEAPFLQFPWRLVAILGGILSLSLASALAGIQQTLSHLPEGRDVQRRRRDFRKRITKLAIVIGIAVAMVWPAYRSFHQPCEEEDTAAAQLALIQSGVGTAPTDEYTPSTADNDSLKSNVPAFWLTDSANSAPEASSNTAAHGPAPLHFAIEAQRPEFLVLNLREYPAWRVYRNAVRVTDRNERDDGLLTIPIPAGKSSIEIYYARTWDQVLGDLISGGALLVWIVAHRRDRAALRSSDATI